MLRVSGRSAELARQVSDAIVPYGRHAEIAAGFPARDDPKHPALVSERVSTSKRVFLGAAGMVPNVYIIESMLPPSWPLTPAAYFVMYAAALMTALQPGFRPNRIVPLAIFCLSWVVVELVSLLTSSTQINGVTVLAKLIFVGLGYAVVVATLIRTADEFAHLLRAYLIFALVVQLEVAFEFVREGMPLGRFDFFRAYPIPVGALGAISAIILIILKASDQIKTIPFVLMMLPSLAVIAISSSKGPVVSLVMTTVLLAPVNFKKPSALAWFTTSSAAIYIMILNVPQFDLVLERFKNIDEDRSTTERLGLYLNAAHSIIEKPILGSGMGAPGYPHNFYLQILAEGGVVLLLLGTTFTVWLVGCYLQLYRRPRPTYRTKVAVALVLASLSILLFSYTYVDLKFLYLGVGLYFCRGRLDHDTSTPPRLVEHADWTRPLSSYSMKIGAHRTTRINGNHFT